MAITSSQDFKFSFLIGEVSKPLRVTVTVLRLVGCVTSIGCILYIHCTECLY